mmetsp:Transcript_12927/g.25284  ORF Transcript_12927/g.25284 Transcript_12927/m.25284 type:complete len:102 (-) Transcript_12927:876-1181(-)
MHICALEEKGMQAGSTNPQQRREKGGGEKAQGEREKRAKEYGETDGENNAVLLGYTVFQICFFHVLVVCSFSLFSFSSLLLSPPLVDSEVLLCASLSTSFL